MSVTATPVPATGTATRNEILLALARQAAEEAVASPHRAVLEKLLGAQTDEECAAHAARCLLDRAGYRCDGHKCEHVFEAGEVVYRKRKRIGWEPGAIWRLQGFCEECVSTWHPSWLAHARPPLGCGGGCGILVSHWQPWQAITTCSARCTEIAFNKRRRVRRKPRPCEACGELYFGKRGDTRYCSNACRQDAYRKRKLGLVETDA